MGQAGAGVEATYLTEGTPRGQWALGVNLDTGASLQRSPQTADGLSQMLYHRPYTSDTARTRALAPWLHRYNHHRHHTAIGDAPITRVTNLPKEHS